MCDMTYLYMWHYLIVRVPWLNQVCDMTHLNVLLRRYQSVSRTVAACCRVLQCVECVCCSCCAATKVYLGLLQCVPECCSVSQRDAVCALQLLRSYQMVSRTLAVCCSVLQHACCSCCAATKESPHLVSHLWTAHVTHCTQIQKASYRVPLRAGFGSWHYFSVNMRYRYMYTYM